MGAVLLIMIGIFFVVLIIGFVFRLFPRLYAITTILVCVPIAAVFLLIAVFSFILGLSGEGDWMKGILGAVLFGIAGWGMALLVVEAVNNARIQAEKQ